MSRAMHTTHSKEDGHFDIFVRPGKTYRFELGLMQELVLANPTINVAEKDLQIELVVKPKPYSLFGEIVDSANRTPIKDSVLFSGTGLHFNTVGSPAAKYALFFDSPGQIEFEVGSKGTYLKKTIEIDVQERLQRFDVALERMVPGKNSIAFTVKIRGIQVKKYSDFSPHLSGENYFHQWGRYIGDNVYEFILAEKGIYKLSVFSQHYHVHPIEKIRIDGNQMLEVGATEKNTWLAVEIVDSYGKPIGFPRSHGIHMARKNCVILERLLLEVKPSRHRYLSHGLVGVGGALRPDENGKVRFLLEEGGEYVLLSDFERYQDVSLPIQIESGETKLYRLQLKSE